MKQRKYATATNPTVEAIIGAHYRYKTKEQADARLKVIAEHFVLSKEAADAASANPVMWIKGFDVTEEDVKAGFTGHFAELGIEKKNDSFTITATKVARPLSVHPQKKRVVAPHPNWGHPVMRAVKKAKKYETPEAAYNELQLLHSEYPDTTIPGANRLFVMVYEKRPGVKTPLHKIILEIKPQDGAHVITWRDNVKGPKTPAPEAKKPEELVGRFTTMVEARRKRKQRSAGAKPKPKKTEE